MPISQEALTTYMNGLAEAAGIPQDQRPAFLARDEVKKFAHNSLEAVEREKGRAAAVEKQRQDEYQENLRIFNKNKAVVDAYVARYGELPGGGDPNDPAARTAAINAVDQKTLDERVGKAEGMALEMAKIASTISIQHFKEFNEVVDFDAVQKLAVEKGLNARQAYDEFVKDRRTAKQTEAFENAKKAEYERGLAEGASKRAAAAITDAAPQNGFMENFRKKADATAAPPNPAATFAEAWTGWKPQ